MKRLLLSLLLVSLHSAPARADGFFEPPEPTPERRAELDALCSRLEALGLPAIPPEAEWVYTKAAENGVENGSLRDVYFDKFLVETSGNAWRLPSKGSGGTNVFVTVDGRRIVFPPDSGAETAWAPARIQRDIVALHTALHSSASREDELRPQGNSVGRSLLFAAELFRSGREAVADALVAAIERDPRGLSGAERDAAIFRARADVRAAGLAFYASGDFAALAAALEDSLRRIPPLGKTGTVDFDDMTEAVKTEIQRDRVLSEIYEYRSGYLDLREEWLSQLRPRLAGEPPPELAGLDEENQALARALAEEPAGPNHYETPPHFYHDNNLPWLLPAAWTNFVANADDVQTRILRRGPAALPLLAALAKGDSWPVVGDWRATEFEDAIPPFCTRADVAKRILTRFAFAAVKGVRNEDRAAAAARLRDRLANATEDDVARFYLAEMEYGFPDLLEAWLTRRAAEAPIPWLEDDILAALQGPFDEELGTPGLTASRALHAVDAYFAVRGEAASSFRDRLVETLRTVSKTAAIPGKEETILPYDRVKIVEYLPPRRMNSEERDTPEQYLAKLKTWATDTARQLSALALASGDPDDIRRRGETLAAWYDRTAPSFQNGYPPYPLPRLNLSAPPSLDKSTTYHFSTP